MTIARRLPIHALESSLKAMAAGDDSQSVPFTAAEYQAGELVRSIAVLKTGAAGMERQRWLKSNVAKLTAGLRAAESLPQFGGRLVPSLVPLLGGGAGGFYLFDSPQQQLSRIACYGLKASADTVPVFGLGAGLVGQCVLERGRVLLTDLLPVMGLSMEVLLRCLRTEELLFTVEPKGALGSEELYDIGGTGEPINLKKPH